MRKRISNTYIFDILSTLSLWRIIYLRATQSIRSRYIRSKLGEFWSVLSVGILIISTGLIWTFIWGVEAEKYLPYVACGHIIYLFVSATINESTSVIVSERRLFYKLNLSPLIAIHILVFRNVVSLIHNIPILILIGLWSPYASIAIGTEYILYLLAVLTFVYFTSIFFAVTCVYYRDLVPLVGSILQISFLITPVIWEVERIPEVYRMYVYINPFASAIEILRNPLLGNGVSEWAIYSLLCWISIAFVLSYTVWKTKCKQLIYWI